MQSKLESAIETITTVAIGFIGSLALWQFVVAPIHGITVSFVTNLSITAWFTCWALLRGYIIRRFFARGLKHWVEKVATRFHDQNF